MIVTLLFSKEVMKDQVLELCSFFTGYFKVGSQWFRVGPSIRLVR